MSNRISKPWTGDGLQPGRVPHNISDVIDMLQDRIRVHTEWRDWLKENPENGNGHESAGDVAHHQEAIDQYEAAVALLNWLTHQSIPIPIPIPMLLHCPHCHTQHVDAPDPKSGWTNPPHKSHLCHHCGAVWRPAEVPTAGVASVPPGKHDRLPNGALDGPDVPDGHDHEGFPGGCERFGHTPEACPAKSAQGNSNDPSKLKEQTIRDILTEWHSDDCALGVGGECDCCQPDLLEAFDSLAQKEAEHDDQ